MADEGASPQEQLLESARRNNTDLLSSLFTTLTATTPNPETHIATLINTTISPTGLTPLHLAASTASFEVLDALLDQPGVETDPLTRRDRRTPLHLAVVYVCEELGPGQWSKQGALGIVEILLDAGCDPRIRDKDRRRPVDLCDPRCVGLVDLLRRAEMQMVAGGDVVDEDAEEEEEAGRGPPSDSD